MAKSIRNRHASNQPRPLRPIEAMTAAPHEASDPFVLCFDLGDSELRVGLDPGPIATCALLWEMGPEGACSYVLPPDVQRLMHARESLPLQSFLDVGHLPRSLTFRTRHAHDRLPPETYLVIKFLDQTGADIAAHRLDLAASRAIAIPLPK